VQKNFGSLARLIPGLRTITQLVAGSFHQTLRLPH
jgi:hypothetical protein